MDKKGNQITQNNSDMAANIFKLDWFLIDSIIIILLILILIIVNVSKDRSRWRTSFSNETIECVNYERSDVKFKNQYVRVKNWSYLRNIVSSLRNKDLSKPIIIIFKIGNKRKLLYILTEGLVSRGFEVIFLNLNIKPCKGCDIFEKSIQEETKDVIEKILEFLNKNEQLSNLNYFLVNTFESNFSYNSISSDPNNSGMILINPILNDITIKNFSHSYNETDLKSLICTIFSKKSNSIASNKNLKNFLEIFHKQNNANMELIILEKANKMFKYYETILLGLIISFVEKNSFKTKNMI